MKMPINSRKKKTWKDRVNDGRILYQSETDSSRIPEVQMIMIMMTYRVI